MPTPHTHQPKGPVALDIDNVLANFTAAFCAAARRLGFPFYEHPVLWDHYGPKVPFASVFQHVWGAVVNDADFWRYIRPLDHAHVPFEVEAYVTARPPHLKRVTKEWLGKHGFPDAPVYCVGGEPKGILLKALNIETFVDDRAETVAECIRRGVRSFVIDHPSNQHDEGLIRVRYLTELHRHDEVTLGDLAAGVSEWERTRPERQGA